MRLLECSVFSTEEGWVGGPVEVGILSTFSEGEARLGVWNGREMQTETKGVVLALGFAAGTEEDGLKRLRVLLCVGFAGGTRRGGRNSWLWLLMTPAPIKDRLTMQIARFEQCSELFIRDNVPDATTKFTELLAIRSYLGVLDSASYTHSYFRLELQEIRFPMIKENFKKSDARIQEHNQPLSHLEIYLLVQSHHPNLYVPSATPLQDLTHLPLENTDPPLNCNPSMIPPYKIQELSL
ncbi:hypothetical protein M5K25_018321 [Dendrobium thyrsiflorum]|uniref:Uncharacterized protein n=1 Tax=Dendrobium thyrsiflorum TaxID=117978 RepID=A0ABD0UIC1_DENTH